jgi:hypothetical protein
LKHLWSLLFLICCAPLFAQSYTARWTAPTTNTDGSAITQTLNYNLYQAACGSALVKVQSGIAGLTTTITKGMIPGTTQCFALTALNTTTGMESAQTSQVQVTVPQPTPNAPGGLTVTLATTSTIAYGLAPANDALAFLIVGSVPLGTPCLLDQSANLYHVVSRAAVTYDAPYRPTTVTTVFALCGA